MSYELLDLTQYQGKYPDSIRVEGEIWPHFVALLREDKILRRALEMALNHDRFSGDCPAECDESACWSKLFIDQAAAEMEKEAADGQD